MKKKKKVPCVWLWWSGVAAAKGDVQWSERRIHQRDYSVKTTVKMKGQTTEIPARAETFWTLKTWWEEEGGGEGEGRKKNEGKKEEKPIPPPSSFFLSFFFPTQQ